MEREVILLKKKIILGFVSNFVGTDGCDSNPLSACQGPGCYNITCDDGGRTCQGKCQNYYPRMNELQFKREGRKYF